MNIMLIVLVPLVLIIVGMVLNSIGLSFDQPPTSPEQDPTKRLAAERETFRQFFDHQRKSALKRQQRTGQFAWLLMFATIGAFTWLYMDTVAKTVASNRIDSLQTIASQEEKGKTELVLSLNLKDGTNVKYVIKTPQGDKKPDASGKEAVAKDTVSSWELEKLATALSTGDALPLGIALKMEQAKIAN